jgi:site-specific DNA-methyltransferase (adenine-specific)
VSYHEDELLTLHLGDCVDVMRELPAESVDAVVTDPPYNLGFMGKAWDSKHQHEPWAREAFRVAKPGAHLLAFGGTRTYHRLASAIEDAGWEIRDCLVWAYASGFPKSLDVSKAIDKAAGAEREVTGSRAVSSNFDDHDGSMMSVDNSGGANRAHAINVTAPATPDAARWDGWGTALKPAWEPIVMARKPLRGTVAANVQEYGTGALNIDASRVSAGLGGDRDGEPTADTRYGDRGIGFQPTPGPRGGSSTGRWPANLLLTDPIFDGGVPGVVGGGEGGGGYGTRGNGESTSWDKPGHGEPVGYGDAGTYSRFFLVPKSSRSDREPLLRGMLPHGELRTMGDGANGHDPARPITRANVHPTVKPLELMRHLVRLVTPPGGTVLDCFLGSGTTAIAANAEGFRCIGIEREQEYLDIAVARLAHQPLGLGLDVPASTSKPPKTHPDLSKHQPKRRAPSENYTGGWAGTIENPADLVVEGLTDDDWDDLREGMKA